MSIRSKYWVKNYVYLASPHIIYNSFNLDKIWEDFFILFQLPASSSLHTFIFYFLIAHIQCLVLHKIMSSINLFLFLYEISWNNILRVAILTIVGIPDLGIKTSLSHPIMPSTKIGSPRRYKNLATNVNECVEKLQKGWSKNRV